MRVLVLVQTYPDLNGDKSLMYVHVRNRYYVENGLDVDVLKFSASESYRIDGVNVMTESDFFKKDSYDYDILICHAPNLKNHYRLLRKMENKFQKIVIFFHGHEIVKLNEVYPAPYDFLSKNKFLHTAARGIYDCMKLKIWKWYIPGIAYKTQFIFVSNSLFDDFKHFVKLDQAQLQNHVSIIPNSVGTEFENQTYDFDCMKEYDFVTVRSNLDKSVYCIDILRELALKYPKYRFLVVGKGKFFEHGALPENLIWVDSYLSHDEICRVLDRSRCALMLTRRDTQGVMSCEFATYGIPVITSDLNVCKDVLGKYPNVAFVHNDPEKIDLDGALRTLSCKRERVKLYCADETIGKEIALFKSM